MTRGRTYSDEDLLGALRLVAQRVGEPVSTARYTALQQSLHLPNWLTIVHRYGTWNAACSAAGLSVRPQAGGASTWTRENALPHVGRFMREAMDGTSYSSYAAWAKEDGVAPSAQTVRNVFGAWSVAKDAARDAERQG